MNHPQSVLSNLGFSENEILLYMTLLHVGTSSSSVMGRRANLPRSTAQYTCDQLVKKGIARVTEKGNTRLYSPEPPDKILLLLEREHRAIEKKEQQVQQILEPLRKLMNPHSTLPRVQFYEGKEGIMELFDKFLELDSTILSFEDNGELKAFMPDYVTHFVGTRIKSGVWNRVICGSKNPINTPDPKDLRDTRMLSSQEFPFSCDIKICKNLVSICSFDKQSAVGVAIDHPDLAKNFRVLFESYWTLLDERNAKKHSP